MTAAVPCRPRRGEACWSARRGSARSPRRRGPRPRTPGDPSASSRPRLPLFSRSGGVLVSAYRGGVDVHRPLHRLTVVVDLHMREDPVPGAVGGPSAKPLVGGLPRPVPLRDIPPGRTGRQFPQDRVEDLAVLPPTTVTPTTHRKQRLDPGPCLVGDLVPAHHHPRMNHTHGRSPGQALVGRTAAYLIR